MVESGTKVFRYRDRGYCLKATGVATSCDKARQVLTSCDQMGSTLSQGLGTFRAVSEGPVTFRKQRQTFENDLKITKIEKLWKMDSDTSKWVENPSI